MSLQCHVCIGGSSLLVRISGSWSTDSMFFIVHAAVHALHLSEPSGLVVKATSVDHGRGIGTQGQKRQVVLLREQVRPTRHILSGGEVQRHDHDV
jgi:hypothetical protein